MPDRHRRDDPSADLLLELYLEATYQPDDPYAFLHAITRRLEATEDERRILDRLKDLEIARLYEMRDPETGKRVLHQKNIAAKTGMSVPWVSKAKKEADPERLASAVHDATARLRLVAADERVPPSVRIKAQVRANLLTKAINRFTAVFSGAAATIGALWVSTKIAALVKTTSGGATGVAAAGGGAVVGGGLLAGGATATGGGLAVLTTSAPAIVQAGVLAVGTYAVGAPVVETLVASKPPPAVQVVAEDRGPAADPGIPALLFTMPPIVSSPTPSASSAEVALSEVRPSAPSSSPTFHGPPLATSTVRPTAEVPATVPPPQGIPTSKAAVPSHQVKSPTVAAPTQPVIARSTPKPSVAVPKETAAQKQPQPTPNTEPTGTPVVNQPQPTLDPAPTPTAPVPTPTMSLTTSPTPTSSPTMSPTGSPSTTTLPGENHQSGPTPTSEPTGEPSHEPADEPADEPTQPPTPVPPAVTASTDPAETSQQQPVVPMIFSAAASGWWYDPTTTRRSW